MEGPDGGVMIERGEGVVCSVGEAQMAYRDWCVNLAGLPLFMLGNLLAV